MVIRPIAPQSFASNCYLIVSDGHALVVDPAVSLTAILTALNEMEAVCEGIVLTHGHFDHMLSLDELRRALPDAPVYIHAHDASYLGDSQKNAFALFFRQQRVWQAADRLLHGGDTLPLGAEAVRVLHTPGHTPGSICLACGKDDLITGDTLFESGYGRCDLMGGSLGALVESLQRLKALPEHLTIHPGHGGPSRLGAALNATGLI